MFCWVGAQSRKRMTEIMAAGSQESILFSAYGKALNFPEILFSVNITYMTSNAIISASSSSSIS